MRRFIAITQAHLLHNKVIKITNPMRIPKTTSKIIVIIIDAITSGSINFSVYNGEKHRFISKNYYNCLGLGPTLL